MIISIAIFLKKNSMNLFLRLIGVTIPTIIILCIWRLCFPFTDFAFFALTPIFVVLLVSSYKAHFLVNKHIYTLAIKHESQLKNILSGRLSACCRALLFSSSATFTIAYVSISLDIINSKILIFSVLFGFFISLIYSNYISKHLNPPYSDYLGIKSMSYFLSLLLVGSLAQQSWAQETYSVSLMDANFLNALLIGIKNAPKHSEGSMIAEVLAPLYAYDAFKFWAVNKLGGSFILKILLSIDSAIVGVLLAKSIISVSFFFNINKDNIGRLKNEYS